MHGPTLFQIEHEYSRERGLSLQFGKPAPSDLSRTRDTREADRRLDQQELLMSGERCVSRGCANNSMQRTALRAAADAERWTAVEP